jgi:glucose/arabinose dehydrogenase
MYSRFLFPLLILCWAASASIAEVIQTKSGSLEVSLVVADLDEPWAFGFLPDGGILITERGGQLWLVKNGRRTKVRGMPRVAARGQGGLLDVLVSRDFATSRTLFFTYAKRQRGGAGTAVFRAELAQDGRSLRDGQTIFEMTKGSSGGRHFGSRLVEAPDGTLFVTVGDRGDRPSAQDLSVENGSVLRITRDGVAPKDNPFIGREGVIPEIWSFGHRNPQGAALDRDGQLWINEHGAKGGDEVNRVVGGANYGWPVIAYGRHYSGRKIGEGTAKPGMEQPETYWDPSIAPSGMAFYDGNIASWRGDAFIGSLKFDYISRLSGAPLREIEQISGKATSRVRDVRQGPDGALWFLSVGNGGLYRMAPK